MDDGDDDSADGGNLELYEGDISMVLRSDGEMEFLIAIEDESSEEYVRALNLVRYIKFALKDGACKAIFEKSLLTTLN